MRPRPSLVLLGASLLVAVGDARAGRIADDALGASFALPEGFQDLSGGAPGLRAFSRGVVGAGSYAVLRLHALAGEIGREPLDRAVAERAARRSLEAAGVDPSTARFDYRTVRWKGFDLELFVSRARIGDGEQITLVTQVPLVTRALQIELLGPAADEPRLAADLAALLASLDGRASWTAIEPAAPTEKRGPDWVLIAFFAVAVPLLIAAAILLDRRRRARRDGP